MNNYIIIITIIVVIFIFSGDKNLMNQLINNKSLIILSVLYLLYNNFNLIFILLLIIGFILSNDNIRKIIYNRYHTHIDKYKIYIKQFLDIKDYPEPKEIKDDREIDDREIDDKDINDHAKLLEDMINEEPILEDNDKEIQKIIDEIEI